MARKQAPAAAPEEGSAFLRRARSEHGTDVPDRVDVRRMVTSSPALNRACGIGGLPLSGRYVVLIGPWAAGKSTVAARLLGDAYRAGGAGLYLDVERTRTTSWFRACGAPDSSYVYAKERTQEETQERINSFFRDAREARQAGDLAPDAPVLAVVDTVTDMVPEDKLSGKIGARDHGLSANLLNDWVKAALVLAEEANGSLVLVSQERRTEAPFHGAPDWMCVRPTTGDAVAFAASVLLRVEPGAALKEGEAQVGREHRLRVLKSKFAPDSRASKVCPRWAVSNGSGHAPLGLDLVREAAWAAEDLGLLRRPSSPAAEEPEEDVPARGRGRSGVGNRAARAAAGRLEASWDAGLSWSGEAPLRAALRADREMLEDLLRRVSAATDAEAAGRGHVL